MADRTNIHLLGPGTLTLGGVDVGYISAAKLSLPVKQVDAKVAAYGDAVLDKFDVGGTPKFSVVFNEASAAQYAKAISGADTNTSGSDIDMTMGKFAGVRATTYELLYVPLDSAIATAFSLKAWRAVPVASPEIDMGIEKPQELAAEFEFLIDESKADGEKQFRWGNVSVSADTTAPTLSSIVPASGATVSAPSTVVLTFSEALNPATVTTANIQLFNTSTNAPVPGSLALSVGNTVVTFTPTSAPVATGSTFVTVVTSGLKDASNNAFAGDIYPFTTS